MKRYLLDTSLLAAYLHNRTTAVRLMTPWVTHEEAVTSILVYGEVIEYLKGLQHFAEKYAMLHRIGGELRKLSPAAQ
jgi:hypothetical protein